MGQNDAYGPSSGARPVRLLVVKSTYAPTVLFLSDLQGSIEHWDRKRTVPCRGPDCPPAIHRGTTLYYAYAAGLVWDTQTRKWSPVVIQATSNLEEQLRGRSLRGEVWTLIRGDGRGPTGDLSGVYVERWDVNQLIPPFDPRPVICRAKGLQSITLGAKNPTPPRLVLPEVELPAPALPTEQAVAGDAVETIDSLRAGAEQAERAGMHRRAQALREKIDRITKSAVPGRNGTGR